MKTKVVWLVVIVLAAALAVSLFVRLREGGAARAPAQPVATRFRAAEPPPPLVPAEEVEPVDEPVDDESVPVGSTPPVTDGAHHPGQSDMPPPAPETVEAIRKLREPTPTQGQVTTLPDGSKKLDLGNSAMSVPVATVGKDGKVHVDYHGEKYISPPAAPPSTVEKKP